MCAIKRERRAITDVLLVFTICFNRPTSFVVWKKCASSINPILRTLALCCHDAVGAVCDLYKMTTHDLVVLPVFYGETDYLGLLSEDGPYLG